MNPSIVNLLNLQAAYIRSAKQSIDLEDYKTAKALLDQSSPHTAHGDGLDYMAEAVGAPLRNGLPVPDDAMRDAILREIGAK